MKKFFIGLSIAIIIFAVSNYYFGDKDDEKQNGSEDQQIVLSDHKNIEYTIEGAKVKLTDGLSETEAAPGSASKIVTRYFGNEVRKDLNADGREDVVFLLTQEQGGSGTFFYVVAALKTQSGYVGSEAVLLGDRIAPQTTESGPGNSIIVNYADRKPGEPMTADPSLGKSLRLILDAQTMQFGEVAQDFEGEADPSRMTLAMKSWSWVKATFSDGKEISPKVPGKFTLTFSNDGKFSATTDCNSMGGDYSATKDTISFGMIFATEMYCEGSQESDFSAVLLDAESYRFTSKGELIIELKDDKGRAIFR